MFILWKTQEQVRKLVAGPGVYICDECVKLCDEIVEEEVNDNEPVELRELPNLEKYMMY